MLLFHLADVRLSLGDKCHNNWKNLRMSATVSHLDIGTVSWHGLLAKKYKWQ